MGELRSIQVMLLMLLLTAQFAPSGEVIEGIVATVNGHPVLTSQLDQAIEYQCLLRQTACDISSVQMRDATLQRLIEQTLVQEQMKGAALATNDREVAQKLAELRQSLLAKDNSDSEWLQLLDRHGLSENDVAEQVRREILIRRYIDGRFRSTVHIERDAIEAYYEKTLLPQLQKFGGPVPAFASVEGEIREILMQQEIDKQFSSWLEALRQSSKIEVR
jgi:hypothetical protein